MIIFSEIKATANGDTYVGLVSGIPNSYNDLEGWTGFEAFLADQVNGAFVEVKVQVWGYGEGEAVTATVEEVAYMYKRQEMRPDFLEARCEKLGSHKFTFDWDPSELF